MQGLMDSSTPCALPPLPIDQKVVRGHLFSRHDNRHALQNDGVYFGRGLGRRKLSDVEKSQHYSFDLISWQTTPFAKTAAGHRSTYLVSYSSTPDTSSLQSTFRMEPSSLRKFHVITKDGFHRFPHKHRLPASTNQFKPTTDTTAWFNQPHMTPLQVLAQTQQPFTKKNQWKYSYKFR